MTLFICIATFAPLSNTISNLFIIMITFTLLLLILLPLILIFVSKFDTDQKTHKKKLDQAKKRAIASDTFVLESDPVCRKHYLRFPKFLFLMLCPFLFIISMIVLYLTKNVLYIESILLLRTPFLYLTSFSAVSFLPLLIYWMNCNGTSKVQRIYIHENQFIYTGYSGSTEERQEFSFALVHLDFFTVRKRAIWIKGSFYEKKQKILLVPIRKE